ncbi:MAG: DUF2125 domain-containing protein [Magnetospirillum sp.]|nr:DUF2125 domain-containing protein [Magnetospirillum sp.]
MKRHAKHAAYAAAAIVFVWSVAWMFAAQRIVQRVDAWRTEQAASGVKLDWDQFDVKGWPFGWRVDVRGPRAAGAGPAAWMWSGERLVARAVPWNLAELRVTLPGAHRASFGAGDLATRIDARAAKPDAIFAFEPTGKLARLDLAFEALEVAVDGGKPIAVRKLDFALAPHRPARADHTSDVLDASLRALGVRLAEPVPALAAFGTDIARAELVLEVRGPLSPGASFGAAVRAWRDAGGTIEIKTGALDWAALRLGVEGTLALDERDRPLGAGTVRLAGWSEALDALQAARAIEPAPAALLKVALNFLARTGGGEAGTVRVPMAAQDGRLVVHRVPVAPLPALRLD